MLKADRVLLASHGTPGARAAERAALALAAPAATIFHLVVVPDLWKGMMGDDWLNNASTRAAYGRHVESQLAQARGDDTRGAGLRERELGVGMQVAVEMLEIERHAAHANPGAGCPKGACATARTEHPPPRSRRTPRPARPAQHGARPLAGTGSGSAGDYAVRGASAE